MPNILSWKRWALWAIDWKCRVPWEIEIAQDMILSDGFEVLWHQAGATSQSFDLEFYGSCQSMNSKRLQQGRPSLALHLCGNCHKLSHLRVLGCYNDARQEGPSTKNLWVQTGCLDWMGLLDMCTATIWWVHDSQGIRESTLHHFATEHWPEPGRI